MYAVELAIQLMKILVLSKLDESLARGSFASCHACGRRWRETERGSRRRRRQSHQEAELVLTIANEGEEGGEVPAQWKK